jgi:hydroxypyruvate reductase
VFEVGGADGPVESGGVVEAAVGCLSAGVERADPARATREAVAVVEDDAGGSVLVVGDDRYSLSGVERVVVLGGGKGSDRVAATLVDELAGRVTDGVVVVDEPTPDVDCGPVTVRVGDHPVPSERGVAGAQAVRALAASADASTLVLAVVTGGASALLPAPVDAVGLDALRSVTRALLDGGATIDEVNAVRKHVSALKGGRLAVAAAPARVVTVAISDVVGDDPSVIGSGPTVGDASTFAEALDVVDRYDLDAPAVRAHLEAGARGAVAESPAPESAVFDRTGYHVVASARTAVAGVLDEATERGFASTVLSTTVTGEARECGAFHAAVARDVADVDVEEGPPGGGEAWGVVDPPAVLVSAGETTVAVSGDGTGGPNQEFVLGAAVAFASGPAVPANASVAVAAVDTDGRDGGSDVAGAVLSSDALDDASVEGRPALTAARDALARNDATGFLERYAAASDGVCGGLLRSGATGTNVNDLRVVVVSHD